jgi:DNA-binding MarR family transcriptional regulator
MDDRRLVYVTLTGRAAAMLEQLTAAHREELRRIGPELRRLVEYIEDDAGRDP